MKIQKSQKKNKKNWTWIAELIKSKKNQNKVHRSESSPTWKEVFNSVCTYISSTFSMCESTVLIRKNSYQNTKGRISTFDETHRGMAWTCGHHHTSQLCWSMLCYCYTGLMSTVCSHKNVSVFNLFWKNVHFNGITLLQYLFTFTHGHCWVWSVY